MKSKFKCSTWLLLDILLFGVANIPDSTIRIPEIWLHCTTYRSESKAKSVVGRLVTFTLAKISTDEDVAIKLESVKTKHPQLI